MANPIAGWYPDPSGDQTKLRWWDGNQWTDNYADAVAQATAQSQQPAQPQAAPQPQQTNQGFSQPQSQFQPQPQPQPQPQGYGQAQGYDRLLNSQGRVTLKLRVRPLMTPCVSSPLFLLLFLRFQYAGQLFRLLG